MVTLGISGALIQNPTMKWLCFVAGTLLGALIFLGTRFVGVFCKTYWSSALQCVTVCCSELQCVAVQCSVLMKWLCFVAIVVCVHLSGYALSLCLWQKILSQCVALCCIVLHFVRDLATFRGRYIACCYNLSQHTSLCVAVRYSALQCVAVCVEMATRWHIALRVQLSRCYFQKILLQCNCSALQCVAV